MLRLRYALLLHILKETYSHRHYMVKRVLQNHIVMKHCIKKQNQSNLYSKNSITAFFCCLFLKLRLYSGGHGGLLNMKFLKCTYSIPFCLIFSKPVRRTVYKECIGHNEMGICVPSTNFLRNIFLSDKYLECHAPYNCRNARRSSCKIIKIV
jgi:hypothetical protein